MWLSHQKQQYSGGDMLETKHRYTPKEQAAIDQITLHDVWGFQTKKSCPWLPESVEDEISRLEFNLHKYQIGINYGNLYPPEVNEVRKRDFQRIIELGGSFESIPSHLYLPVRRLA
jgi:hypothetical protein